MFAKPIDSGISIAIAKELEIEDPEFTKGMEILDDNTRTDRDHRKSCEESTP